MNSTDVPPTRVRTAIALSIAVHVCAFWLLAMLLGDRTLTLSSALEASPALIVTTIVHREPAPARRRAPPPRTAFAPRPTPGAERTRLPESRPRPRVSVVPGITAAHARPAIGGGPQRAAQRATGPPRAPLALVPALPATTPTPVPTVAAATPAPTATSTPPSTPTPSAVVAANFDGLFSQNYPPALAARSDLTALHSRLSGPVHIRVDVDETGRATEVHFVRAVDDPALETAIRSALLALHYVPADCNGLHCEGTLEINY